ncbi:MAG: hypothetical protein QOE58_3457, partial [Actinomycetota bacterium]|nr:hypothetical protein [Actinomycetota bacterium]
MRDAEIADAVDQVVGRLEDIERSLPPQDGIACFNQMYLTVTQLVRSHLVDHFFADPTRMQRLDATFAGLYLAAVDAEATGGPVPPAWAPLFARRHDHRVIPIQFAIAGMNAHINHDLPMAVEAVCAATDTDPQASSFHRDYLRVNELLAAVDGQVRESFLTGAVLMVDQQASPVLDLIDSWSIDRARDAA